MDPQERADQQPVLELRVSKEPLGRSLLVGLACIVVICRRVRRRKPFENVLFNLCPCGKDSVSTEAIRIGKPVGDYIHFISSTSFDICCIALLVLSVPMQMSV